MSLTTRILSYFQLPYKNYERYQNKFYVLYKVQSAQNILSISGTFIKMYALSLPFRMITEKKEKEKKKENKYLH